MTAAEQLAQYQVTIDQAREWVMANLNSPQTIFNTAREFGVTSAMLAEIVDPAFPGVTAKMVEDFFTSNGLDGSALNMGEDNGTVDGEIFEFLPEELSALANLITLNTNTGILSTASLRTSVLSRTNVDDQHYYDLFDPSGYEGSSDGTFTGADLGVPGLANMAATTENLESLYYGTLIKTYKSIDMSEIMEIENFTSRNEAALAAGSPEVSQQMFNLIISMYQDPANPPIFPDVQVAEIIIIATTATVELMGGVDPDFSLFDGLFNGFLPG